jgi:hypothetical protein
MVKAEAMNAPDLWRWNIAIWPKTVAFLKLNLIRDVFYSYSFQGGRLVYIVRHFTNVLLLFVR